MRGLGVERRVKQALCLLGLGVLALIFLRLLVGLLISVLPLLIQIACVALVLRFAVFGRRDL